MVIFSAHPDLQIDFSLLFVQELHQPSKLFEEHSLSLLVYETIMEKFSETERVEEGDIPEHRMTFVEKPRGTLSHAELTSHTATRETMESDPSNE